MPKYKPDRTENLTICWTKDYDRFAFSPLNRKVRKKQVEVLYNSMLENGFLKWYFLFVIKVEGRFFITSGQHRFLAAKQAEIPFAYVIVDSTEKEVTMIMEHIGKQSAWNMEDVLHFHTERKLQSYIMFQEFVKSYEFPIPVALQLVIGLDPITGKPLQKNYHSTFKNGDFKVSKIRIREAGQIAEQIHGVISSRDEHSKYAKNSTFIKACYVLLQHKDFRKNRLRQALDTSKRGLRVMGGFAETLEHFTDLYNGTLRTKRIGFPEIMKNLEKRRARARKII